jgi:NTE family protein
MLEIHSSIGLVLTGGGARGAYQAGALRALAEISRSHTLPFPMLSGVSSGSINAVYLAARADDFQGATQGLADLWSRVRPNDVFFTDPMTLARTGAAWLSDLGLGSWLKQERGKSLLVTDPLVQLINSNIHFDQITNHIRDGLVQGIAVTATNYFSGTSVTFYDGVREIQDWLRSTRISVRTSLRPEHIMASSAIPIFFPAILVDGSFYGDGCVRMNTPLSPAIHMGAKKIIAIGVRHERSIKKVTDLNSSTSSHYPHLAEVGSVLLNAMFLDALEYDVEKMERINQAIQLIPDQNAARIPSQLRDIPTMVIKPSQDLGNIVAEVKENLSFPLRFLIKRLSASGESGWDLLSYLAFDSAFTSRLVDLGYKDAMAMKDELAAFL